MHGLNLTADFGRIVLGLIQVPTAGMVCRTRYDVSLSDQEIHGVIQMDFCELKRVLVELLLHDEIICIEFFVQGWDAHVPTRATGRHHVQVIVKPVG